MPEKTTYSRHQLRRFEMQLQADFELALWKFLHTNFGPECEALRVPVGHLKSRLMHSNSRAVIDAMGHAVEVIAAALDSPEMRQEMRRLEAALALQTGQGRGAFA